MRIFYGVQGTGNGHITRARVMAKELYRSGIYVDFLFTGRAFDQYFDMQIFNNYQVRHGLSIAVNNGRVSYPNTLFTSKPIVFVKDVKALDLLDYDLVISDFEPVTAWAAKTQGVPVLGLGHQYAFRHNIPKKGSDLVSSLIMKCFAPVDISVGLHWHHFKQPILSPIIETSHTVTTNIKNKIIVYLPFEDTSHLMAQLLTFTAFEFHIYTSDIIASPADFIVCKPLSRDGFQKDLIDCAGIISNAGFELASEALHMGKKILVKPLYSQIEQISNAAALEQLGYGRIMSHIDAKVIGDWLIHDHSIQINYPNTARILVQWIQQGLPKMSTEFIENIWSTVNVSQIQNNDSH